MFIFEYLYGEKTGEANSGQVGGIVMAVVNDKNDRFFYPPENYTTGTIIKYVNPLDTNDQEEYIVYENQWLSTTEIFARLEQVYLKDQLYRKDEIQLFLQMNEFVVSVEFFSNLPIPPATYPGGQAVKDGDIAWVQNNEGIYPFRKVAGAYVYVASQAKWKETAQYDAIRTKFLQLDSDLILKYDKTGGTVAGNVNLTTGNQYKINNVDLKDVTETLTNKTINLENNNLTQTTITPLDEVFANGDKQEVLNNKTQGQIDTLKINNPTQLNPTVRYVSKQGDDSLNGQVDRKKETVDGAVTSLVGQSSGVIHVEADYYNTDLILGTANSRINIIGEEGSQRTVFKSITYTENNQQCELTNLKFENTDNAPAINVNSTLSNYVFRNITCGGNHVSNVFLNIASGGSGFINLIGFDISNKIINFENTTTPRLAFISQSANASINAGTGWTIIIDNNSANILELSNNNNVLRGAGLVNSLIPDNTTYNVIVSLGSAGNGFYAVNYNEAGVFAKGDIILRQHPITVVYSKHYNTQNANYYDLTNQITLHKENGGWSISANKTELQEGLLTKQDIITASNGLEKVVDNIQGIDATTLAKGVVQLSNAFNGTSETLATTEKALKDGLDTKANQLTTYTKDEVDTNFYNKAQSDARFQDLVITVSSEAEMLALSNTKVGYQVVRTDLSNQIFRLNTLPASTLGNWSQIGGGAGSQTLASLTDTTITTPANNQILQYKTSTGKWENEPAQVQTYFQYINFPTQGKESVLYQDLGTNYLWRWDIATTEYKQVTGSIFTTTLASGFPNPGNIKILYIESTTNKVYRWDGSAYQVITTQTEWGSISGNISDNQALQDALDDKENTFTKNTAFNKNFGTTTGTVCEGNDARLSNSRKCNNTFDNITTAKVNLGINNIDNTSDLNKPISNATQNALNTKSENFVQNGVVALNQVGGGAYYVAGTSEIGAIRIRLPQGKHGMISMTLRVYMYGLNVKSFDVNISGYAYNNNWAVVDAAIITSQSSHNYTVRFYSDVSYNYIYIGETNSSWFFFSASIVNFKNHLSNVNIASWADGWDIGVYNTFRGTLRHTLTDTLPASDYNKLINIPTKPYFVYGVVGSNIVSDVYFNNTTYANATILNWYVSSPVLSSGFTKFSNSRLKNTSGQTITVLITASFSYYTSNSTTTKHTSYFYFGKNLTQHSEHYGVLNAEANSSGLNASISTVMVLNNNDDFDIRLRISGGWRITMGSPNISVITI